MASKVAGKRSFFAGELVMSCDPMVWMLEISAYKTHCAYCWNKSPGLRTCSGCRLHRYCDSDCQAADWKVEHKLECAMLKELGNEDARDAAANNPPLPIYLRSLPVASHLTTKLINKIRMNATMDIPGMGLQSVEDLLLMLPANPLKSEVERMVQEKGAEPLLQDLTTCMGILSYNGVNIYDVLNPFSAPIGRAVYPQAPRGEMTPVCWDINVVMNRHGRRLFIHVVEDIPQFTGLGDLRYNDMEDLWYMTRAERRAHFELRHGRPCTCRKCTEAYDADINPLQCVTVGCSNQIPSDNRALEACSECGALNGERLTQFRRFAQQYATIKSNCPEEYQMAMILQLCKKLETAGILQPDAHFRYVCGQPLAQNYYNQNRFDEGWKMMKDFGTVVRKICPKYTIIRAAWLLAIGRDTTEALETRILSGIAQLPEPAKQKLQTLAGDVCRLMLEYADEAKDIFSVLFGNESLEAQMNDAWVEKITSTVCRIEEAFTTSDSDNSKGPFKSMCSLM
ncbi:uncharacterized protein LOC129592314 [Paramacrobiotus metropolitanus]|uniref:uncharacterized protein LOC129592314 n=1 Tax=Paramacrobiotus metropolitanus TaxID=2943436 RepID=UPI0024462622|nr:uncharacterized protein LOC129592314 [Paramacrobiotus metropolitanus]